MEGNHVTMREAITKLVAYLDKEVRRTAKCKRCKFNGMGFRGEPCFWHVDCGISDYDVRASNNAKFLLNKFSLKAALSAPPRNCDVGTAEEQEKRFMRYCDSKVCNRKDCACGYEELFRHKCAITWAQMPYTAKEGETDGV